jgi:hypothetical protein
MTTLSLFEPLEELDGIYIAHKSSLRCTAIKLTDGSLCLFSPVLGLNDQAKESLLALGDVSYLLAPNHYHNKGLLEYSMAFPNAIVCAPENAQARLTKMTGLTFASLEPLRNMLPPEISIIKPYGLKNGEIWLQYKTNIVTSWFVVDAFGGVKMTDTSVRTNKLDYLKTFPNFGIKNKPEYRDWLLKILDTQAPSMIVPCHGAIMTNDTLSTDISTLIVELFGDTS